MPSKVIAMTAGPVGSRFATGLAARCGLRTGHETPRRHDDTSDNTRPAEPDNTLANAAGVDSRHEPAMPRLSGYSQRLARRRTAHAVCTVSAALSPECRRLQP